jgi:hypothetical protein
LYLELPYPYARHSYPLQGNEEFVLRTPCPEPRSKLLSLRLSSGVLRKGRHRLQNSIPNEVGGLPGCCIMNVACCSLNRAWLGGYGSPSSSIQK